MHINIPEYKWLLTILCCNISLYYITSNSWLQYGMVGFCVRCRSRSSIQVSPTSPFWPPKTDSFGPHPWLTLYWILCVCVLPPMPLSFYPPLLYELLQRVITGFTLFHSVSSAIVSLCHLCSYLILRPCFALIPLEIDLEGKAKMRSYLNTVTPIVWSQLNSYKRWDHLPCSKSKIRLNLKTKSL